MRFFLRALSVSVAGLVFCLALSAQNIRKDIVYTTDATGAQRGDLYEPLGNGPFPAIVFLHGGSWRSGNKSGFKQLGMDLARKGFVGFSIDYDLKAGSFPLSWQEARAAVRFVREHAGEYHIDPKRIVIAGTSAGGELAALVALAPSGPASLKGTAASGSPVPVSAAVILNGVFDLCFPVNVIERYMGGNCAAMKDAFTDASPFDQVHPDAPPFFVGHGTKDHVVPYQAAQVFVKRLQQDHDQVTPFVARGGPHMYWTKKKYYAANLAALESFLAATVQ